MFKGEIYGARGYVDSKPKRNGTNLMMIVICSAFAIAGILMVIYGNA